MTADAKPRSRPFRQLEKRVRKALVAIAVAILPRLYLAYMWLVYRTSRVEYLGCTPDVAIAHYGKAIVALWHEEVFFVAYAFRRYRPHTLASRGDFGDLIARMLELCDFVVFRGGSSAGRSRNAPQVLRSMIHHMNEVPGVLYGVTVDGSNGPRHSFKPGAVSLAVACRAPIVLEKTWCRFRLRLPTWDRTVIPLPFNHIVHLWWGPHLPPRNARDPQAFEAFRRSLEERLVDLTHDAGAAAEGRGGPKLLLPFDAIEVDPPRRGIGKR
ncbi:MAG: hypothetical protein QOD06_1532 [Candidatus Binatota bacterium]|jgi:lysophospholipid acyltransferase (LPLAT)-like uncharacterized protein|nr:hypothetical protein [Candidatus Binatota bacterium]